MLLGYYTSAPLLLCFGVVYPAYSTFKALQSGATPAAMMRWLQYWMIFSVFTAIEWIFDIVGAYLPLYYEIKVCFVLWLMTERFEGATFLYTKYVDPLLTQHQGTIDQQLALAYKKMQNFKVEDVGAAVEWVTTQGNKIAAKNGKPVGAKASSPKPAPAPAAPAPADAVVQEQSESPEEDVVDVSDEAKKAQ